MPLRALATPGGAAAAAHPAPLVHCRRSSRTAAVARASSSSTSSRSAPASPAALLGSLLAPALQLLSGGAPSAAGHHQASAPSAPSMPVSARLAFLSLDDDEAELRDSGDNTLCVVTYSEDGDGGALETLCLVSYDEDDGGRA